MQKDALIERIASLLALIAKKRNYSTERTVEQTRLVELRRYLYSSIPDEIDFEEIVFECNEIDKKYSI